MSLTLTDQAHAGIRSLHAYEPGKPIEDLKRELRKEIDTEIFLNIIEVRKVELDATQRARNLSRSKKQ